MAVDKNLVVDTVDLSSSDFVLAPSQKYGYTIIDFGVSGASAGNKITVKQAGATLNQFPAHSGEDDLIPSDYLRNYDSGPVQALKGYDDRIPLYKVPSGTKLSISGSDGSLKVLYQKKMADQVPATEAAGTKGGIPLLFTSTAQETNSIAASSTETFSIVTSKNPSALRDFPYGEDIPAGWSVELLGIATNLDGSSGADVTYDGLRMWLFDESQLGKAEDFIDPGIFPYPTEKVDQELHLFRKPYAISGPEELTFEVKASNSGASAEDAVINMTCVFLVKSRG